eukprot:4315872-Pleurochrysis_carterae.AAC.1
MTSETDGWDGDEGQRTQREGYRWIAVLVVSVGAGVGSAAATSLRREGGRCERPSTETGTTTEEPGKISNKAGRITT